VHLQRPASKKDKKAFDLNLSQSHISYSELNTPMDGSEITSFKNLPGNLKSPDENYFAVSPVNKSPSNDYRSADCNELLAEELNELDDTSNARRYSNLVSQSSIEIPFDQTNTFMKSVVNSYEEVLINWGRVEYSKNYILPVVFSFFPAGMDNNGFTFWNTTF
jgi:hypothetical protein